ncbi:methyl-accepting chemotaxis protein [Thalassospira australica]|uniref:methyl-accepting chemotaxis protein n=1 Tax=Thalassospira australica TaxID=1528106 RepID=UPI000689A9B0|nr:methyl-accepting chemotaxis protein [Thalassospira australica]
MTGNLGLRGRLMMAIVPIALLAVIAAGLAVFAFRMTQTQQSVVTNEAIPALVTGQALYARSNLVSNIARNVAVAQDGAEIETVIAELDDIERALNEDISILGTLGVDGAILSEFSSQTKTLVGNIRALKDTQTALFANAVATNALLEKIVAGANSIEAAARSQNTDANMALTNSASALYSLVGREDQTPAAFDTLDKLLDVDALDAQNMSDLRAIAFQIPGLAEQAVAARNTDALDKVKFAINPILTQLQKGIDLMPDAEAKKAALATFSEIQAALDPSKPDNLFALRQAEFATIEKLNTILDGNAAITAQIAQTAERLLGDMRAKIDVANDGVAQTIVTAEIIMIAVAITAIVVPALILWLYVSRNLLRRLIGLNGAMTRLTKGDLDAPIKDNGSDEIADMAKSVETFRENAREAERLRRQNKETEDRAEEQRRAALHDMADGFESSVNSLVAELLTAVNEMRDTADNMERNAGENVTRAAEVNEASQNASHNVSSVSSATEELSASIREIERQVAKAEEISKTAVAEAHKSDETVRQMSESADRIGEVIELITTIADQTNLLALNATIESARAGDAGKGFAVVANEVKNLASQTQRATEDISQQIAEMRTVSNQAVEMISTIARTIAEIDSISSSIAAAMSQQGAATGEIASGSEEAANGVRHVSDNMADVSRAAEAVREMSGSARTVAEDLLNKSQRLQDEANGFVTRVRAS